jgi:hypothetical protein
VSVSLHEHSRREWSAVSVQSIGRPDRDEGDGLAGKVGDPVDEANHIERPAVEGDLLADADAEYLVHHNRARSRERLTGHHPWRPDASGRR